MSLKGLHHKFDTLERNLWEESVGYACGARFIARHERSINPEEAFLAGLMSNIGEMVCNNSNSAAYRTLLEHEYAGTHSRDEIALEMFGYSFAQSSGIILDQWNLAPEICICALMANEPEALGNEGSEVLTLTRCVFVSRGMCRHLGVGNHPGEREDIHTLFSRGGLELNAEEGEMLVEEFAAFFNANKSEILCA